VRNFDGSYSEYLELARTQAEAAKPTAHSRTKYVQSEIKAVLSAEEKREYSNLNKDMEKIAKKIAALQKMIENSPNGAHDMYFCWLTQLRLRAALGTWGLG
jgi:ATPase subunit of ABC transporter with duplicated ATPase domains